MDGPVDFTLDRARLMSAQSLGNYEGGYEHAPSIGRSGTDMARVGTPSSLAQYPGRFIPPSLPLTSPGGTYMMNSFLNGGSAMSDHLKSLMPDIQQYWSSAHGDGCRYIVNNNTIYSPYLSGYLPATESLSLFAHNLGTGSSGQAQVNAYHRIYDLHKEALFGGAPHGTLPAALYPPVPAGISPPRITSESHGQSGNSSSVKKEGRHGDSKRSTDNCKHSTKTLDSHSKVTQQNSKHSREHDKKSESKKSDKNEKTSDIKQENSKSGFKSDVIKEASVTNSDSTVKKQKVSLTVENNKDDTKTPKSNKSNGEVMKSKSQETVIHNTTDNKECSKEQTTIPTLTTVTLTPGDSVTSPLGSPSSSAGSLSPNSTGVSSDNGKQSLAQTSTTFSLPYYHAIYSHSQPSSSPEVKKVHAPTFTPEIGTLPSVVSVVTLPVQTTACDMRIKKEKSSYSCCKEKCVTVMSSNINSVSPKSCVGQCNIPEKSSTPQKPIKKLTNDTKEGKSKKSKSYDTEDSSVASVKPVSSGGNKLAVRPVTYNVTPDVTKEGVSTEDIGCDKTEKSVIDLKSSESSEKSDGINLTSHTEHDAQSKVKGELKASIKGCSDRSRNNVSSENSVSKQLNTHMIAAKQEKRLLKIAPNVGTLDTLPKKGSDIKHQGRKMKVMSPERDVTLLKSSDFKRVSQSKQSIRSRDVKKGDNHGKDESSSSGMNIPIGIAVAQKREELKGEGTEQGNDPQTDGSRNSGNDTHHRTDGQPSAFPGNGPVITKSSSPNASVTEMRNTLPANLIVTGSANGAGIAWSDDPSARHFGNPWLPSGHHPSSWVNQMPFTIPPNIPTSGTTDPGQLPVSVPPGYKLVQDSVTGQLMIIPATNLDVYDANRLWGTGFPSAGHPGTFQQIMAVHQQQTQLQQQVLAQHQERQPSTDYALIQQYQQQFQHLYHPRQDVTCSESPPSQTQVIEHSKTSKEIQSSSKNSGPSNDSTDKDKHAAIPSQPIQDLNIHSNQTLPYQYPATLPIVYNTTNVVPGIPVSIPETITVKTEASTVQSRGTSPMVPASEIDDTSQETIDSAPSTTESSCDHTSDFKNTTQSIASVQTCVTDVSCCSVSVTSLTCSTTESVDVGVENNKEDVKDVSEINNSSLVEAPSFRKEKNDQSESTSVVEDSTGSDEKVVEKPDETKTSISEISDVKTSIVEKSEEKETAKSNSSESEQTPAYDVSYGENYNPFLDPQILQAADGLELLSTLAEKRAKCVQLDEVTSGPSGKDCDKRRSSDTQSAKSDTQKPKKKQLSRTRSVPAKSETKSEQPGSYYTSTGLRIPQGEEEINAIELDMRIRLAELQRLYKEKQRQLAKLHPKRDKEDLSKRGPGRPRKRKHPSSQEQPKTIAKLGPAKGKDGTVVKKKKQAEELVDRVFRKTGGGFGMPLSKKLKANAMAALFKTQSGFTVKRKGSTSSPIAKSCDSIETHRKVKKPLSQKAESSDKSCNDEKGHIKSSQHPSLKETSQINKKHSISTKGSKSMLSPASFNKKPIVKKIHREENDFTKTKDDVDNGLGMLAKYATSALNDQPPTKKAKKKEEGVCSQEPSITNNEACKEQSNIALPNVTKPAVTADPVPESSPDSASSGNKKRKPGRPRKCNPNATTGVTETIVARNSKNFRFFQFQTFEDVAKTLSPPSERKPKVLDNKKPITPIYLDEEWLLRRSERIFLSEPSPQPSPNNTAETPQKSPAAPPPKRSPSTSTSVSAAKSKSEKAKLQKAKNIQELTQKVKRKYSKQALQNKTKSREKQQHQKRKEKAKEKIINYESDSSSGSEGDNIPLSELRERPSTPEPRSCVMDKDELQDGLRVLVFKDGLFYEGAVQGIRPPDVYGVLIDNERGNRPHIYSREEILKEVIIDVKPNSCRFLVEGTRVCAYWSQQFSCLYPGTVAKASPNPHSDQGSVIVEFDDGDSGRIPLDHIRMLTADFPIVSYDPNPLLLIGKRRRHTTTDSTEMPRKSQSSDSAPKQKRGPGRPPKVKKEDTERESEEELEVDVCGVDEEHDDVFTSNFSMESFRKERSKSTVQNGDKQKSKKRKENTSDNSEQTQIQSEKKRRKRKESSTDDDDDNEDEEDENDDDDDDENDYDDDDDRSSDQAFLPARQLWRWSGKCTKRPGLKGKAKKEFYKAIVRGKENIMVGDCAVFLSTGRPHLPYIGRIDSMWEAWGGQMVVKVKWFYHPEETRGGKKLQDMKGALFQSLHIDENDVQTISHKCEVLSYKEYNKTRQERKKGSSHIEDADIYYLAGTYEPTIGLLKFEKDLEVV